MTGGKINAGAVGMSIYGAEVEISGGEFTANNYTYGIAVDLNAKLTIKDGAVL